MAAADNGGAFKSSADQKTRARLSVKSNTTLIGAGSNAGLVNACVMVSSVENVIIRNLHVVNPCDVGPVWRRRPPDGHLSTAVITSPYPPSRKHHDASVTAGKER